jgi:hypothetical protein
MPRRCGPRSSAIRPPTTCARCSTAIPRGAAPRGNWGDIDFLRNVHDLNPTLQDTQFADYHGHGWNFRAIFKRDREGNLLDAQGNVVSPDDPEKFQRAGSEPFAPVGTQPGKAVHLMDIHAEKGPAMRRLPLRAGQPRQRADLRRGRQRDRDRLQGLPRHRRRLPDAADQRPRRAAARQRPFAAAQPDGKRRFEWMYDPFGRKILIQRSIVDPSLQWQVRLVRDSRRSREPALQRQGRARQADEPGGRGKLASSSSGPASRPRTARIPTARWPASPAT